MRSRYVLYYQPSTVKRQGFHTVDVSVNRRHAQVRARRGYVGPIGHTLAQERPYN